MSTPPSAAAIAAVVDTHRRFDGRIVYRQVLVARRPRPALWRATMRPWRWNGAFPTLYTALSLDVAFAERIKRTGARRVRLLVGSANASIARTVDFTDPEVLSLVRLGSADLTTDDHALTQALGIALFEAGITAVLVPAAIANTARDYPQFRVVRDGQAATYATPAEGANLVIFRSNRRSGDAWPERMAERFQCELAGLPASGGRR